MSQAKNKEEIKITITETVKNCNFPIKKKWGKSKCKLNNKMQMQQMLSHYPDPTTPKIYKSDPPGMDS